MKILILRLSSIGDILLSSSFIRQVRTAYPDAQVDFVIKEQFHDLVRYNPHLNNIYLVKPDQGRAGLKELRAGLIRKNYSCIFDLHNNFRTRYLTASLTADYKNKIRKDKFKRALLVYFKINNYKEVTAIPERYLKVSGSNNIVDDGLGLEIFWNDQHESAVSKLAAEKDLGKDYTALAPAASFFTKSWPAESYQELIKKICTHSSNKIVLLGGPQDKEYLDGLVLSDQVVNLAGLTGILESAVVLSRAKAVVSNDSGLMHLAAAVKTPVLAIFGSTVKELGFFPYRAESTVIENNEIKCRPCSHVGRRECPKKHFKCMTEILPETVFSRLREYLV